MTNTYLRDAARRRAARYGGSYQRALQALTRYDTPRNADAPPRNPAGIDWTPLHGVEVAFDNGIHQLRGVVLPPDGVRPGTDILRVAVTTGHTGLAPAEVTYLDARRWTISPMPADVDRRHLPSRRLTRGARGLPLYRYGDLPAAALATRTMLRQQYRSRPAEDQAPIAELFIRRDYYDLYTIDDAVALRALTPARHAVWIAARTCSRCREQSPRPFQQLRDGNHYCPSCYPLAADDWWNTRLQTMQTGAIDWARALTTDPRAVLINVIDATVSRVIVTDIASGTTLHDHNVCWSHQLDDPAELTWLPEDERHAAAQAISPATLGELLAPLRHRRILAWRNTSRGLHRMAYRIPELPLPDPWSSPSADDCERWYSYWLHQPAYQFNNRQWTWATDCFTTLALLGRPPIPLEEVAWTAAHDHLPTQARADIAQLHRMAAGLPGPEDIEETQATPTSPCHVHIRPDDLDQQAQQQG
ncbi:hypothetical protein [Nocardia salmonicida]|uniref:hypothetical protein n=1 Tax=Nocardia salmonicida TaxID=53431 RepID=UPI0007A3F95A|nr:hypothetical protein [Nocardia salmonicida]MBC7299494.1 hypothetical protein [Nocardia sp.]